jgi:diguanylate cyclase (GGDEF)-like protein
LLESFAMLPPFIKNLGKTKLVIALTFFATFLSFGLSSSINFLREGVLFNSTSGNAIIIPLILTPVIATSFVRLMFQLDLVSNKLEKLSFTDELTEVHNRRYFFEKLELEFSRAKRYNQVFSLLMIDIDDFKIINDTHGHPAGDVFLREFANICKNESREIDEFARLGGDEFGFLLPCLQQQQAEAFADRLRILLENSKLTYRNKQLQSTISIGLISWNPDIENSEMMFFILDNALNEAKVSGKNKIKAAVLNG